MSFITFHNNIGHNLFTKVVYIFYMEDVKSLISQIVNTFKWMVRRVIFQSISLRRQEDTSELSFYVFPTTQSGQIQFDNCK